MNQLFLLDIMKDFINPLRPYWLELSIMVGLLFFLMFLGICETIRKSGRPAWGGFVPFYNLYLLFDIAYRKGWKCLLLLVPIYNIYVFLALPFDLAKKFHHKNSFGFFLLLFPFGGYPVLGFDDKKCVDPIPRKKKVVKKKLEKKALEPAATSTPMVQISEPNLEGVIPIVPEMPSPLDVLESEEMPKAEGSIPEIQVDTLEETQNVPVAVENSASIFDLESTSFRVLKESFNSSLKSIEEASKSISEEMPSDLEQIHDVPVAIEEHSPIFDLESTSFNVLKNSFDASLKSIEEANVKVPEEKFDNLPNVQSVPIEVEDSSSIFDLESPSFRILKDSFDASLKDIENREEFKIQEVSVPKESVPLFGETVIALLKNSMENSLKIIDASISREEPVMIKDIVISNEEPIEKEEIVSEKVSVNQEDIPVSESVMAEEENTNINDTLLGELTTINAMFDQVEEEESRKTEVKEEPISTDENSNVLSSEISLIDSILS